MSTASPTTNEAGTDCYSSTWGWMRECFVEAADTLTLRARGVEMSAKKIGAELFLMPTAGSNDTPVSLGAGDEARNRMILKMVATFPQFAA